jgi:hypothetical protein
MTPTTPPPNGHHPRSGLSRLPLRWTLAGRSREGALYRRVVRELVAHVGGSPSHVQEMVIGRVAWLQVHLSRIDERAMRDGGLSPHATREYLAWSNSVARLVQVLGMQPSTEAKPPTLQDYLATNYGSSADRTA